VSSTGHELPLGRLEALSDGVFAIAITLLVLELGVSANAGAHLFASILHQWPSYLAYVTSFLTIGVVWLGHSAITSALRAADGTLYRLNLLVLLLASFLPFPTKLVAEFIGEDSPERTAVVFYGLVLLALDISLTVLLRYAAEQRQLLKDGIDDVVAEEAWQRRPSYAFYAVAIGVGFLLPTVGVALYLAIAVFLAVPMRTGHRLLRRR
jgi:uncharacterized membrane protein